MTIQHTDDYSVFKRIMGNRSLNKAHIQRLMQAISQDASCTRYNPILINENWEVVDGQHRLEAMRELGLSVYFIQEKGLTLSNVQALNYMTKPWTPMDYAKSYAELGNKNYQQYVEFKHKYHLNHDILMKYLALSNPITGEMFRMGKLKVYDPKLSQDLCKKLLEVGEFYPRYQIRSFALAFQKFWESDSYDHERMVAKLKVKPESIEDFSQIEDYMRALEALYNHGLPTDKRVRFF